MNGYLGIAICTYYFPKEIDAKAKTCAEAHGFDFGTLSACVQGEEGDKLFKASEYYTDGEMRKFIASNHTVGIPQYGTAGGISWGIPIIRINGVVHKDTPDAYELLGERICKAAGSPKGCSCALT